MAFADLLRTTGPSGAASQSGFSSVLGSGYTTPEKTIGNSIDTPMTPSDKQYKKVLQETMFPKLGKGLLGDLIDAIPGFRDKLKNFKLKYNPFPFTKGVDLPVGEFISNMYDDDPEILRLRKKLDGGELLSPPEMKYVTEAQINEMFGVVLQVSSGVTAVRKPGLVERGGPVQDAIFPENLPAPGGGRTDVAQKIKALAVPEEGVVLPPAGAPPALPGVVPEPGAAGAIVEQTARSITAQLPKAGEVIKEMGGFSKLASKVEDVRPGVPETKPPTGSTVPSAKTTFDMEGAQALYDDLTTELSTAAPDELPLIQSDIQSLEQEVSAAGYKLRKLEKENRTLNELLTGTPRRGDITRLESELDSLIGYTPGGLHWKQEYGIRMQLLDAIKGEAPADVVANVNAIEQRLVEIRDIRAQAIEQAQELSNVIKTEADVQRIVDRQAREAALAENKKLEGNIKKVVEDAVARIQKRVTEIKELPIDEKYRIQAREKIEQQLKDAGDAEFVKRQDIARELSAKLDASIRQGEVKRGAQGHYEPKPQEIHVFGYNQVRTVSHEIGHHIETLIEGGVYRGSRGADVRSAQYAGRLNLNAYRSELLPIATKPAGGTKKIGAQLSEGLAEFLARYIVNPTEALDVAPRFYQKFETFLAAENPTMLETLQNARVKWRQWQNMPASKKVLSQMDIGGGGEPPQTIRQMMDKAYTYMVNAFHPVEQLEMQAMGVKNQQQVLDAVAAGKLRPEEVPSLWYRRYRGASGIATNHWIEKRLQPIYKSVEDIADDFRVYILSKRIIDRSDIEFGIDEQTAKKALEELSQDTSKWARLEAAGEKYQQYNKDLTDYLVKSGVMSDEGRKAMEAKNQWYAPAKRVMEDVEAFTGITTKKVTASGSPIKTIRGSLREIVDPLEQTIADTYRIVDAAEKNRVGQAIVNLTNVAEKLVTGTEKRDVLRGVQEVKKKIVPVAEVDLVEIAKELGIDLDLLNVPADGAKKVIYRALSKAPDKGLLGVYQSGEMHFYRLPPEAAEAVHGMNEEQLVLLTKLASKFTNLLKVTATGVNPEFSLIRNPVRDQITAGMQSRYGYVPFIDGAKSAFQMVFDKETYRLWYDRFIDEGGSFSYFVSSGREGLQKKLGEVLPTQRSLLEKVENVVTTPYEFLIRISGITEQLTRVAAKQNAADKIRKLGIDDPFGLMSNLEAREITTDFARRGAKMSNFNAVYAFLNPRVQGIDKLTRSVMENPARAALYWLLWGVSLPTSLYLWNRQFPRYEDVKEYEKDNYFIVMTNNDPKWAIRIPKPDFVKMVAIPLENAFAWLDKKSPRSVAEIGKRMFEQMAPVGTGDIAGTAVRPWLEMFSNYNFFYGRQLIPDSLKNSPPEEQYNAGTSEAAKALGRIINVSPIIIDNFVQAYLAGTGRMVFQIGDILFKKEDLPEQERGRRGIPLVDSFLGVNVTTPYDVSQEILETKNQIYNELFFGSTDKATQLMEKIGYFPTVEEMRSQAKSEVKRQIKKGDLDKAASLIDTFGVSLTQKEIDELTVPEIRAQQQLPKSLRKIYQERMVAE